MYCYAYEYGFSFYVNDNGVQSKFAKDPQNEDLRAQVGEYNALVARVMGLAGVDQLHKEKRQSNMQATISITKAADRHSYVVFTWEDAAPPCKRYRVTKTQEIDVCGEIDAGKYDSVEEITD